MDLEKIRGEINSIDEQLVSLFVRRMHCCAEVAQFKMENGRPLTDRARERAVLHSAVQSAPEELRPYVKSLFTTLFSLSKTYQGEQIYADDPLPARIEAALGSTPELFPKSAVVACQGVEGAYSFLACDRLFGGSADIMYFRDFESVFSAVEKGLCQYGILPVENSSYGSVYKVYDLMRSHRFYIARSLRLHISHCLLAPKGAGEIREIFSHEQAIGQCSDWLREHPGIKLTVCENTAAAAEKVASSGRTDAAAISSANCAAQYGLEILSRDIQNSDNNYTRFICISRDLQIFPGANKMSALLTLPHETGSLCVVLSQLHAMDINLTKLESRPIPGTDFEFMFYLDMEASPYSEQVRRALGQLAARAQSFEFLGCYGEL